MRLVWLTLCAAAGASAVANAETAEQAAYRVAKNGEVVFNNYPPRALKAGEQGVVGFVLTLDKQGEPTECQVTHSSGHPLLDRETCALVVNTGVFKPVRNARGKLVGRTRSEGFVSWQIPGREKMLNATKIARKDAPDKIVCRRIERTGSLVATSRVCKTGREWARTSAEQRQAFLEMQGIKGTTNIEPVTQVGTIQCPSGSC